MGPAEPFLTNRCARQKPGLLRPAAEAAVRPFVLNQSLRAAKLPLLRPLAEADFNQSLRRAKPALLRPLAEPPVAAFGRLLS